MGFEVWKWLNEKCTCGELPSSLPKKRPRPGDDDDDAAAAAADDDDDEVGAAADSP